MKILHIVEPLKSGVLTAIETLVQHTPALEHLIIYDEERSESYEYLQKKIPKATLIPATLARTPSLSKYISSLHNLIKKIKETSCDVVHCHSSMAGVWGRIAAFYCAVPVFYTPHSFAFLRTDVNRVREFAFWFAEYLLCPLTHTLLACGQDEYLRAQNLLGGKKRAKLLKNSLDLNQLYDITPNRQNHSQLLIGTSGRVSPQKGPELFQSLATAVRDSTQWAWIGAQKNNENFTSDIHCTGWVTREENLELVAGLDIYIQTSRWEGLSYALLEAMALGKTVVVSDIPANRDIIKHGVTGFLCKHEQDFIETLKSLQQDEALRLRVGAAAQKYVLEHHNASINYAKLSTLYNGAIKTSPPLPAR